MSAEGLEPSTNGLKGHCSTIELRARLGEVHSIMLPGYRQHCLMLGQTVSKKSDVGVDGSGSAAVANTDFMLEP
jgi:hypothetical protein